MLFRSAVLGADERVGIVWRGIGKGAFSNVDERELREAEDHAAKPGAEQATVIELQ